MADVMEFPATWEEYEELYGFTDRQEIYTNGSRLIQSFRVEQWLEHIGAKQTEPKGERSGSLIDLYINDSGTIKRIGDNQHDQLTIDEDGKLRYYNLQNGDGCVLGEKREHDGCFYEFVANTDEYGYNCDPRVEQIEPKMDKCYKCGRWNYSHGCQSEKGICEYEPIQTKQEEWNCATCEQDVEKCIYCIDGKNFKAQTDTEGESHEIHSEGR